MRGRAASEGLTSHEEQFHYSVLSDAVEYFIGITDSIAGELMLASGKDVRLDDPDYYKRKKISS
jgi:hypothetical protein